MMEAASRNVSDGMPVSRESVPITTAGYSLIQGAAHPERRSYAAGGLDDLLRRFSVWKHHGHGDNRVLPIEPHQLAALAAHFLNRERCSTVCGNAPHALSPRLTTTSQFAAVEPPRPCVPLYLAVAQ
jgi:hypothetical protein